VKVPKESETALNNVRRWLGRLFQSPYAARDDLNAVVDVLNVSKARMETLKIVVESWPKSVFVDRMAYLGTALFALGGAPFAATGGIISEAAILVALVLWGAGAALLGWSLEELRREDRAKFAFFRKEFGIRERI
jgi:hypothetical protein